MRLTLHTGGTTALSLKSQGCTHLSLNACAQTVIDRLPDYGGPSYVIPSMVAQVLETAGRSMQTDVEVAPIPHYMTSNEAGGYTAVIGN